MVLQEVQELQQTTKHTLVLQEVQELQQKVKLVEQADSQQMWDLFKAFDRNHDGRVDLAELTAGLKKFKPDASADAARSSALDVLLLFDKNDSK